MKLPILTLFFALSALGLAQEKAKDATYRVKLTPMNPGSLWAVPVKINQTEYWFDVDSGADGVLVDLKVTTAENIPLKQIGTSQGATGGQQVVFGGKIPTFHIAKYKNKDLPIYALDLSPFGPIEINGKHVPRGGQLGGGYLMGVGAAIDYQSSELIFKNGPLPNGIAGTYEAKNYSSVKLVNHQGKLYVPAKINKHPVYFLCDTGANTLSISQDWAAKTKCSIHFEQNSSLNTLGGDQTGLQIATPKQIKVGTAAVKQPKLLILTPTALGQIGEIPVVGVMGGSYFAPSKAVIDFGSAKILFPPKSK